jgi:DNA polymerase III delta subunit
MLSKWQIWDYFKATPNGLSKNFGLHFVSAFDPLIFKYLKNIIKEKITQENSQILFAHEVSADWIDNELRTFDLFGSNNSFYIYNSEELPSKFWDNLKQGSLNLDNRVVIFFFNNSPILKDLDSALRDEVTTTIIEAPKFWDSSKLFDFIASQEQIYFSYEAKNYILEHHDTAPIAIYNLFSLIKPNFIEVKELSLSEIKDLLPCDKLDQFGLASLFAKKQKQRFFQRLTLTEMNFTSLMLFFQFMQSHIQKLGDPNYLNARGKKSPTRYDKEILQLSTSWSSSEVLSELRRFAKLELLAKKKSEQLVHLIRLFSLA